MERSPYLLKDSGEGSGVVEVVVGCGNEPAVAPGCGVFAVDVSSDEQAGNSNANVMANNIISKVVLFNFLLAIQ